MRLPTARHKANTFPSFFLFIFHHVGSLDRTVIINPVNMEKQGFDLVTVMGNAGTHVTLTSSWLRHGLQVHPIAQFHRHDRNWCKWPSNLGK